MEPLESAYYTIFSCIFVFPIASKAAIIIFWFSERRKVALDILFCEVKVQVFPARDIHAPLKLIVRAAFPQFALMCFVNSATSSHSFFETFFCEDRVSVSKAGSLGAKISATCSNSSSISEVFEL